MGRIGDKYGSEWHLLRWMGRHRNEFGQKVLQIMGQIHSSLSWEDFKFSPGRTSLDAELKGLDVPAVPGSVKAAWGQAWPQTGNLPNWDAVGILNSVDGEEELVLVEAKAHLEELSSSCGAKAPTSRKLIESFLENAKRGLGVPSSADWLRGYYQYANRLALLHFLHQHGVRAHLLFIYFTGDHHGSWKCPTSPQGWTPSLAAMKNHLGIAGAHPLQAFVHDLFLPVA